VDGGDAGGAVRVGVGGWVCVEVFLPEGAEL
jgi:hypothetical protein